MTEIARAGTHANGRWQQKQQPGSVPGEGGRSEGYDLGQVSLVLWSPSARRCSRKAKTPQRSPARATKASAGSTVKTPGAA